MAASTKPEVLHCRQKTTEPRPQVMHRENFVPLSGGEIRTFDEMRSLDVTYRCEWKRADKRERRSGEQLHCLGLRGGTRLVPEFTAGGSYPAC